MSEQASLFDSPEGERRRDEGMRLVLSHNESWHEYATAKLRYWSNAKAGREFDPQHFRIWFERNLGPEPGHPYAWGALWSHATRSGIVINTGRTVKAPMPQSHATRIPIYIGRLYGDQHP